MEKLMNLIQFNLLTKITCGASHTYSTGILLICEGYHGITLTWLLLKLLESLRSARVQVWHRKLSSLCPSSEDSCQ